MKGYLFFVLLILFPVISIPAQVGGNYTYAFLNQTNSARIASLGGKSVALPDDDLNMPFHNPGMLSEGMDNHLVLNYVGYFADINYGYTSYARSFERAGNFAVGLHYINYGDFPYADVYGVRNGYFKASEYALNLMYSRKIDSLLTLGVNLKPIYTSFESYTSFGLAADIGLSYYNPDKLFTASLVLKNMGLQLSTYYGGAGREKLPFEIQAGLSQKLAYAPFRFSFLFQHLQKWDLQYESTLEDNNTLGFQEEVITRSQKIEDFGDNLLRHVIFGVEFMPGENFYVGLGYNYQRRQELKISSRPGMVGFSWGFGFRVSKFHFSYGRASYHLAGASNHFSLSTNLSEFYRNHQN
ncbi:MAG: type IX secretion system protein PorQ [Bacteroidota bacterium]